MFRFPDMHMPYKLVHKNKSTSPKFPDNAYMYEVTLVAKIPRCTDIQQAMVLSHVHCIKVQPGLLYTDMEPLSTALSIIQSKIVSMSEIRATLDTMLILNAIMCM